MKTQQAIRVTLVTETETAVQTIGEFATIAAAIEAAKKASGGRRLVRRGVDRCVPGPNGCAWLS